MAKIFISYRRDDSEYQTDRLHRELKRYVKNPKENIFIDVDNIPYGVDFVEHLQSKVSQCEILLAVIGKRWLSHSNPRTGTRSLDDPSDFVRIEIETALIRGIPVVPVLLDGTPIPSPESLPAPLKSLARRNGIFVNRMSFAADVNSLAQGLPIQKASSRRKRNADEQSAGGQKTRDKNTGGAARLISGLLSVGFLVAAGVFFALDPIGWRDVPSVQPPVTAESSGPQLATLDYQFDFREERLDAVRDLQRALRDVGLYNSTIDGRPGPQTDAAVSSFSLRYGIRAPDLGSASVTKIEAFTTRIKSQSDSD